jgi:hypothetical protein
MLPSALLVDHVPPSSCGAVRRDAAAATTGGGDAGAAAGPDEEEALMRLIDESPDGVAPACAALGVPTNVDKYEVAGASSTDLYLPENGRGRGRTNRRACE